MKTTYNREGYLEIELDESQPYPSVRGSSSDVSVLSKAKKTLSSKKHLFPGNATYTSLESFDDITAKPKNSFTERFSGWRGITLACAITSAVILVLNLSILFWAAFGHHGLDNGNYILYEGSCATSRKISTGWHLLINILSTLLLAAGNSGLQILSAPCREEIDNAHRKGHWVNIGVFGTKNLAYIPWSRVVLCIVLGLSSIPLHLLYVYRIFSWCT